MSGPRQELEVLFEVKVAGSPIRIWFDATNAQKIWEDEMTLVSQLEAMLYIASTKKGMALEVAKLPGVNAVQVGGIGPASYIVYPSWP